MALAQSSIWVRDTPLRVAVGTSPKRKQAFCYSIKTKPPFGDNPRYALANRSRSLGIWDTTRHIKLMLLP